MGIVRPKTRLFIAFSSLFLSGFYLVASDWSEEEWNPSLDLPSHEASLFDDDLSLNDDYHFPSQKDDPFHIFNIAEEPPKATSPLLEPAPTQEDPLTPQTPAAVTPATPPNLLQPTSPALTPLQTAPAIILPGTTPPALNAPALPGTAQAIPLVPGATDTLPAAPATIVIPANSAQDNSKGILINFSNVSIVEFIRFISRASNRNFIFDESTLQFNVSIVSEEPTSLPNIMTALMQVLRVHGLSLMEQGNNILIHNNKAISQVSSVVSDSLPFTAQSRNAELITRVFRLNTLDPEKAAVIIAPLVSEGALVEVLKDTSHLIVTDLSTNVGKIGQLIKSLDAPNSGLVLGQYVVTNALVDSLIDLGQRVMSPIAEGKPLVFVAHQPSNSIFLVSTPFLVDRTLAVLHNLDINVGQTRIFRQDALEFNHEAEEQRAKEREQNANLTQQQIEAERIRLQEEEAARSFVKNNGGIGGPGANAGGPGGAKGSSGTLESGSPWSAGLPAGHIERTKFFIHKLRYRKGEQIVDALGRIGLSLQETGSGNLDLISTIQSIQWLEGSNSLVFTGTNISLQKVRELIDEIDTPLRQVFIEMLILETTLDDSLEYGVNFATRFRGGNTAGAQSFLSNANTLTNALDFPLTPTTLDASSLARDLGYHLGIIGKNITHCGVEFGTVGALVKAVHDKNKTEILMNPRLLVEDNATAEIFVGINTPFKTQSIANDQGSIITNNVEFRDVGTRLKVTPLISNNDIITLDILEEVSSIADTSSLTGALTNQDLGPSTRTSKTTTRVHVPNKFFLVMSGMIQNQESRTRSQVPCLGGAPLIGALFSEKRITEQKRNLMIFIRPQIIDTDEDIDDLTRHQQDIHRNSLRTKKMWKYEVEEALDLLNVKEPDVSLHDSEVYNP
jgi:type III secretion protein C